MGISLVSAGLQAGGLVANFSGYGEFFRNITFFDQEKLESGSSSARIFNGLPVSGAAVMSGSVDQSGKLCSHPVESGAEISDHKIKMPVRFNCNLAVPGLLAGNVIDQLNLYWQSSKKVVIQCTTGVYRNMILESMPVPLTPERIDRPVYELKFCEVIVIEPDFEDDALLPGNPADGVTRKVSVISDVITSKIGGALDYIGGF